MPIYELTLDHSNKVVKTIEAEGLLSACSKFFPYEEVEFLAYNFSSFSEFAVARDASHSYKVKLRQAPSLIERAVEHSAAARGRI